MNHLRFNEYGELISKDIRGVVATSNEADEIFIFYDKDISTLESGYLASARMERRDGLKIGPINLTLTAKSFDTENKANNYGIPSWNDATEKWDVPCRLLKLTDEMLGVDGDLSLSVVYTEVLEGGQKKVKVNQMVIIKVFGAVDNLYTEEQYDNLLGLFLQKDLSGLTTADAVAGINEFIIKQVGETKLITAENLRLYAVAKIVDGSTIAKKSERDANGNVITTTYLDKTTMTPQLVEANVEFNDGINMQDSKITNVGNATNSTDAVNKGQLDIKVEVEITKIIDGIYTVDKATNDKDGNRIDTTYEKVSRKNEISGYVGLDANKKIPLTYLYDGVLGQLEYGGVFNPSVGYPTDTNSLDTNRPIRKGDYFIANADGTAGGVSYNTGDWAIRSADNWQKIDNTDAVASVNGKLGVVVLDGTDIKVGNGDTATLQARFVAIDALINSRYTKSEVYNKTEMDNIIEQIKSLYDLEESVLYNGDVNLIHVSYDNIVGTNFVIMEVETEYTSDGGLTYKKQLNTFTITTATLLASGDNYEQHFSIYNKDFPDSVFNWFELTNSSTYGYLEYADGGGSPATQNINVKLTAYKMKPLTAENMSYDNTLSGLTAENVQEAIDELENEIDDVETTITNITNGTTDISFTDVNLAATNLADAVSEVNDRVDTTNNDLTNEIATTNASLEDTNLKVRINELKTNQLEESVRKVEAGETKGTVSGAEVINLPLNTANGQLKPTLNGRTIPALDNLIENGDFSDGIAGWSPVNSVNSYSNGILTNTGNGGSLSPFTEINLNIDLSNQVLLLVARFRTLDSALSVRTNFYTGVNNEKTLIENPVNNTWYVRSVSALNGSGIVQIQNIRHYYSTNALANGARVEVDYFQLFNLTASHGVTATSGTAYDNAVAEIEEMLALKGGYISSTPISAVNGNKRIKSVGKNLFDGVVTLGSAKIDDGQNVASSSAVRTDFIKVNSSTSYTMTLFNRWYLYDINNQFISTGTTETFTTTSNTYYARFIAVSTDIYALRQLEQGTVATPYETYKSTEMYINAPKLYSLPNGVKDTIDLVNGKYYYTQRIKEASVSGVVAINTTNYPLAKNTGQFINYLTAGGSEIGIIGTDSTTGTGTLFYELATPITTEIPASGNILGNSKGVVYVENIVADVDVYTTKIDITNTDLPIKEIEKIAKLNGDGTETQLNVANAVINVDKLSFTHPSLNANDKVYFIYKYEDNNNVFGLTDIEYYNSNNVIIDSVDGKAYRIVNSVASGVLTQSLVEVL